MTARRLPIARHPHLSLAAQDDERLHAKTLAALRKAGFTVGPESITPPEGADSRAIISAITAAFQSAKHAD